MAIFNPQIPSERPQEYTNIARPISDLSGNQSGKLALEGIGAGIQGGAGLLDTALKKGLSDDIYQKVDVERDKFTEGLQAIKANLSQGMIPQAVQTAQGPSTGKSWLDANALADEGDRDLPDGLESGLERINQLKAAKMAGAVKLNDTDYSMEVLKIAKTLRKDHPDYREFIDDTTSKASGLPVANSYYQNMMLDINRQLRAQAQTKDDMGTEMIHGFRQGVPNMAGFLLQRNNKDPKYPGDAYVLQKMGDWYNLQKQLEIDAKARAERTGNAEDAKVTETKNLTKNVTQFVNGYLKDLTALAGVPGLGSIRTYFEDVAAGRIKANDTEIQQRAMQLEAYANHIYQGAKEIAVGPNSVIGEENTEKILQSAMTPIKTIQTLAMNKDTGAAFFHARQNIAIIEDEKHNNWLVNKDRGALSRQLMGARGILGEQYFPDYIKSMLPAGTDKPISDLFSQEAMSAIQPIEDARGKPVPRYMKEAIQHAKKVGVDDPEYYGKVTNLVKGIAEPRMPNDAKDRLIEYAFGNRNRGVLKELNMDYRDPNTKEWVPGKYRAFNVMMSPAVINGIKETAKDKPENYQKLLSWGEQEYASLFRQDLQTLNKVIEKAPYLGVGFSWNDGVKGQLGFGLVDKTGRPINREDLSRLPAAQYPNATYIAGMLDILNDKVNPALQKLHYAKQNDPAGPGDASQYILQVLQTSGFRPGDTISGATQGMLKAVIKTGNPEMTPQELDKRLLTITPQVPVSIPFAPESNRGELKSFLSNPSGDALPKRIRGSSVGPDETITGIKRDEIPAGMDYREFIQKLRSEGRY